MEQRDRPAGAGPPSDPEPARPVGIRVGITGHRPNKLGRDAPDRIRASLGHVLGRIDASLGRLAPRALDGGLPERRLVSALAEGADRLAVEALPPGWRLVALLPMPRTEYEADFLGLGEGTSASRDAFRAALAGADSVIELPYAADQERSAHYAALAAALVRRIDLLLAVWDGEAAAGPGGTAAVVSEAASLGVGVVHVDPTDPTRVRLISAFPDGDALQPLSRVLDEECLDDCLARVLGRAEAMPG